MPQLVNSQDTTNFLNNGYMSRTIASRDGAGNIILSADTNTQVNTNIAIEPVTSRFSVDTALKLFETRFEYFKFPVQTLDAGSFIDIDKSINAEVANTLAGVSFEQDVITRRMELLSLKKDSDTIDWPVPVAIGGWFPGSDDLIHQNNLNTTDGGKGRYQFYSDAFYNDVYSGPEQLSTNSGTPTNYAQYATKPRLIQYFGKRRLPLANGNASRPGWFRVTPEILNQLKAGGKILDSTGKAPVGGPWKRNIKLKIQINWTPSPNVVNAFTKYESNGRIDNRTNFKLDDDHNGEQYVHIKNGAALYVTLVTDPYEQQWDGDTSGPVSMPNGGTETKIVGESMRPVFMQTTSNMEIGTERKDPDYYGSPLTINSDASKGLPKTWNSLSNQNQSMTIEYVIDSRYLLNQINNGEYTGLNREFAWDIVGNHPINVTYCWCDFSVEQLPDDYITNPEYGYTDCMPREKLAPVASTTKRDQYRSLYGRFHGAPDFLGGVRRVTGKNIACTDGSSTRRIIGITRVTDGAYMKQLIYKIWNKTSNIDPDDWRQSVNMGTWVWYSDTKINRISDVFTKPGHVVNDYREQLTIDYSLDGPDAISVFQNLDHVYVNNYASENLRQIERAKVAVIDKWYLGQAGSNEVTNLVPGVKYTYDDFKYINFKYDVVGWTGGLLKNGLIDMPISIQLHAVDPSNSNIAIFTGLYMVYSGTGDFETGVNRQAGLTLIVLGTLKPEFRKTFTAIPFEQLNGASLPEFTITVK